MAAQPQAGGAGFGKLPQGTASPPFHHLPSSDNLEMLRSGGSFLLSISFFREKSWHNSGAHSRLLGLLHVETGEEHKEGRWQS